jgi:tetratricopeptide (TPR) repeat protein
LHRQLISLLFFLALSASGGVWAQEAPAPGDEPQEGDEVSERARQSYDEAAAAYAAGRYREAIRLLLETARLKPSPELSYNVGLAYEAMGDVPQALKYYRDYLRRMPDAQDRTEVEGGVRRLEAKLKTWGVQQVTILSSPEGAKLSIDDRSVGLTPWTGELAPGRHGVRFELPGYVDSVVQFELSADRSTDIGVTLTEARAEPGLCPPAPAPTPLPSSPAAPEPVRDEADGGRPGTLSLIALGAGAAALAGALVFELQRANAEEDARNASTQVAAADMVARVDSHRSTARLLAGIGAALTITGGVSLVLDLSAGTGPRESAGLVGLSCGGDGCLAAARGVF